MGFTGASNGVWRLTRPFLGTDEDTEVAFDDNDAVSGS